MGATIVRAMGAGPRKGVDADIAAGGLIMPKSGEIIKLQGLEKSEIFITYIRSALVAID